MIIIVTNWQCHWARNLLFARLWRKAIQDTSSWTYLESSSLLHSHSLMNLLQWKNHIIHLQCHLGRSWNDWIVSSYLYFFSLDFLLLQLNVQFFFYVIFYVIWISQWEKKSKDVLRMPVERLLVPPFWTFSGRLVSVRMTSWERLVF